MRRLIMQAIDKLGLPIIISSFIFNLFLIKNNDLFEKESGHFAFFYVIVCVLYFIFKRLLAQDATEKIVKKVDNFEKNPETVRNESGMFEELRPYFLNIYKNYKSVDIEKGIMDLRVKKINDLAENMNEGLVLIGDDGKADLVNTSARRLLNLEHRSEILGLLGKDEIREAVIKAKDTKKDVIAETVINGRDLKIYFEPIVEIGEDGFVILIIDNSENKKLETMRKEFSANVTHELKSPLTSIIGYAELMEEGMITDEGDYKKFSSIIRKESDRLLYMIDDIIRLSRLDEENISLKTSIIDVGIIVDNCLEKFKKMTDDKNIKVVNKVENFQIRSNESLFSDIITNIFENAIKYNNEGGSISLETKLTDNFLKISIADTGIGISKANIGRVFERFYVVDKSRSRNVKSTGLGLSIVKHICDYLNYEIKVDSVLNEGSKFTIKIPRKNVIG